MHQPCPDHMMRKKKSVFTAESNKSAKEFLRQNKEFANKFLIGSFFIDSVLQSMQLIIPQISLPNFIEEIELFPSSNSAKISNQMVISILRFPQILWGHATGLNEYKYHQH